MSGKRKPVQKEFDPMALPELPSLPGLDAIAMPELPNLEDILNPPKSIIEQRITFGDNAEQNNQLVDEVVVEEFAAIHAGRKQQADAIDLANDDEFWCAFYFQTRAQKEHFLTVLKLIDHGDKYLDGEVVAKRMGIELPPRPAPYKVGKLDKKLTELT